MLIAKRGEDDYARSEIGRGTGNELGYYLKSSSRSRLSGSAEYSNIHGAAFRYETARSFINREDKGVETRSPEDRLDTMIPIPRDKAGTRGGSPAILPALRGVRNYFPRS